MSYKGRTPGVGPAHLVVHGKGLCHGPCEACLDDALYPHARVLRRPPSHRRCCTSRQHACTRPTFTFRLATRKEPYDVAACPGPRQDCPSVVSSVIEPVLWPISPYFQIQVRVNSQTEDF